MSEPSKLSWYAHRLKVMGVGEMLHRVGDKLKHNSDASFEKRVRAISLGDTLADVPALPEREAAPAALKKQLALDAKTLLAGDWKLYGWRDVSTGAPPCWHRDASCGVIIEPDELSHKLDYRDLPDGADARSIWEINRWSELTRVAMHGWLNDDADAVRTAQIWLEDWCERNPVGRGINWASPLEAGLRLINFCWFDALVRGCGQEHLTERQKTLAAHVVPSHVAWVCRYRSYGSSANNHLLGELVGLLYAVKRWPELEPHTGSAGELWNQVTECVLEQFATDGGNLEQALHYHLFAWEMAWHARRLMAVNSAPVIERLRLAAEFFVRMVHPVEPWDYGDSDDAQVIPLVLDRADAMPEWQSWLAGHEHGACIAYWMGVSPLRGMQFVGSTAHDGWWLAGETGMAVCEMEGWMLRLDASPTGFGEIAAHGHCDALHLSLWDGHEALVIDPGTGGYYGLKERREQLASWEAHNGPLPVKGFATPKRKGTFLLTDHYEQPQTHRVSPRRLKATLKHEGHGFTRITDVGLNGFVSVDDEHEGTGEFRVLWTFAPECVVDGGRLLVFTITRGKKRWQVELSGDEVVSAEIGRTMVSRRYGQLEETATLEIVAKGRLRSEWARGK